MSPHTHALKVPSPTQKSLRQQTLEPPLELAHHIVQVKHTYLFDLFEYLQTLLQLHIASL